MAKDLLSAIRIPDEAYGAGWNGSLEVPTKNALYDKIETLGAGPWTTVKKTTQTQVRNNSVVLQNDDTLAFVIPANATVYFKFFVAVQTLAAADFKWRLVGSNTPTIVNFFTAASTGGSALSGIGYVAFNTVDATLVGTGTLGSFEIQGMIQNTTTSCTVNFQWAQNTATVGDTKVLIGSYLEYMTF